VVSIKRLTIVWCLVPLTLLGCKKEQHEFPASAKPLQVVPASAPPSPALVSQVSTESGPAQQPSEQQARALRRYNEDAWFVREAMRVAQLDDALGSGIAKLVKAAAPDWDHSNPSHWEIRGAEIAVRLHPWLEMAGKLEPAKRAAALLIADRIVKMEEEDDNLEPLDSERPSGQGQSTGDRPKSATQLALEKLGAQFSYYGGSERYFYTFNWLRQAYDLNPKGRAGELAFLALMKKGFETSPNCGNGSEQFREVIRQGAAFLHEHHSPDVVAQVHFAMGDANRDIVVLAAGLQVDNYADPSLYKPEEAGARAKAIAEYRAGLALDDQSESSKIAKQRLASLEAGDTPQDVQFYCQVLD